MKTLTIKEPWASLIINGYKTYEFRSWKTSYRGKILIHASNSYDKSLVEKFKNYHLNIKPGYIIGEATITDIIKVIPELKAKLMKENPLVYSNVEINSYAWCLENIKIYDNFIYAKGSLNLWEYYSLEEVYNKFKDIKYGYMDINKDKHLEINNDFQDNYCLQTPEEVLKNKIGVCWDQVELARNLLKNYYDVATYFIAYYEKEVPTHTFITVKYLDKYYWIEHAWEKYQGLHIYTSKEELLKDVSNKFALDNNVNNKDLIKIYKYKKPKYHISVEDFFKHCEGGLEIKYLLNT